jgi:antitoxin Phd
MITIISVEAQNRFGQLLDTILREPAGITRYGRAAAFIVSSQDMAELLDARHKRSKALSAFEDWSANAAKRATPEAAGLTGEAVNRLVREAR